MAKTSLVERMKKAGAPKTWVREVEKMLRDKDKLENKVEEYLGIIDALARQVEQEERIFKVWDEHIKDHKKYAQEVTAEPPRWTQHEVRHNLDLK